MGYFVTGFRSLSVSMRNAFRRPTTVQYPYEKRQRAKRYRNSFALLHDENGEERCIGCGLCAEICPSDVITVVAGPKEKSPTTGKKRGTADDFTLDLNACIFCELCVQVCPSDAIVMRQVAEQPAYFREDLCLTMERLYANETAKPATWATGSLLREMQDPKRGKAKPATKKAAPKAVKEAAPAPQKEATPKAEEKAAPAAKEEAAPAPKEDAASTSPPRTPSGKFEPPKVPPPPIVGKPPGGTKT